MATSEPSNVPTVPIGQEANAWLLKQRHEDLSTTFRTSWDLYIKFYTVFLTFSMGAMGWILGREHPLRSEIIHVLAFVLIGQSILTACTSGAMALYSRRVAHEHLFLERAILESTDPNPALCKSSAIPIGLATWSGWANAVAMITMCYAWAYIAFWMQAGQ